MCVAHERSSALAAARAPGLPRYRAGDPLSELEGSSPVRVFVNASSRVCTCTLTLVNENVINHPRLSRSRLRCPGTLLSRASLRERAETRDCVCVSVWSARGERVPPRYDNCSTALYTCYFGVARPGRRGRALILLVILSPPATYRVRGQIVAFVRRRA